MVGTQYARFAKYDKKTVSSKMMSWVAAIMKKIIILHDAKNMAINDVNLTIYNDFATNAIVTQWFNGMNNSMDYCRLQFVQNQHQLNGKIFMHDFMFGQMFGDHAWTDLKWPNSDQNWCYDHDWYKLLRLLVQNLRLESKIEND